MRCVICGSRDINDYEILKAAIKESGFTITEVVSGCASGVDKLGERWAQENGIVPHRFSAEWNIYGTFAGRMRNKKMAKFISPPECNNGCVVAVWDGESKGTAHMIQLAREAGIKVYVKSPPFDNEEKGRDHA